MSLKARDRPDRPSTSGSPRSAPPRSPDAEAGRGRQDSIRMRRPSGSGSISLKLKGKDPRESLHKAPAPRAPAVAQQLSVLKTRDDGPPVRERLALHIKRRCTRGGGKGMPGAMGRKTFAPGARRSGSSTMSDERISGDSPSVQTPSSSKEAPSGLSKASPRGNPRQYTRDGRNHSAHGSLIFGHNEEQLAELQRMHKMSSSWRRAVHKLGLVLEHPLVEVFILFFVVIYAVLVFVQLSFQPEIEAADLTLMFDAVDLVILILFSAELAAKSLAFGQIYYGDRMNQFDGVVIVVSLCMSIFSIAYTMGAITLPPSAKGVLKVKGILRLARLVVIFRKFSETNVSARFVFSLRSSSDVQVALPSDRVLLMLAKLQGNPRLDRTIRSEVKYAMQVISSQTLYDVATDLIAGGGGSDGQWIANATGQGGRKQEDATKRGPRQTVSKPGREEQRQQDGHASEVAAFFREARRQVAAATSKEVEDILLRERIKSWDFDMFELQEASKGNALYLMWSYVLEVLPGSVLGLVEEVEAMERFVSKIQASYWDNPYHNCIHAADVVCTSQWFLTEGRLLEALQLTPHEVFAVVFAGAIHDVNHPSLNNVYHTKIQHELAVLYNDKSVLENHHVAFAYEIMSDRRYNFCPSLAKDTALLIREYIIHMVLATDMAQHFSELGKFKNKLAADDFPNPSSKEDKLLVLSLVVHACDISNPAKCSRLYLLWTERVLQEFFKQGDFEKEAGVPVSMFMDRATTNIAKCQIGFIDIIVLPFFTALQQQVEPLTIAVEYLQHHKRFWQSKVDTMEEKMKKGDVTLPAPEDLHPEGPVRRKSKRGNEMHA